MGTLSKLRQYDEAQQKVQAIKILELGCGERHTAVVLETGNVFVWGCVLTTYLLTSKRALQDLPALPRACYLLSTYHSPLTAHCLLLPTAYCLLTTHQVERQGPARHAARWAAGLARHAHADHAQGPLGAALHSAERPLLWPVLHLGLVVRRP